MFNTDPFTQQQWAPWIIGCYLFSALIDFALVRWYPTKRYSQAFLVILGIIWLSMAYTKYSSSIIYFRQLHPAEYIVSNLRALFAFVSSVTLIMGRIITWQQEKYMHETH